jgi:hypothetical protein
VLFALEALTSRGVAAAGGQSFGLTSGALRMALESTLSKEEKSALHVRLARAILRDGTGLVEPSFEASAHLFLAGEEDEAAELVASLGHIGFSGESAARWVWIAFDEAHARAVGAALGAGWLRARRSARRR